jgi:aspartate carbamoyltransferase catalytic subunit
MGAQSLQKIGQDFKGKDILSLEQFDPQSLQILFDHTAKIKQQKLTGKIPTPLQGKVVTLLFFEPSTRSFGSFSSAVKRLGGQTIEYQNPAETSSVNKGETVEDTARVFECYSDMLVVRHSQVGTLARFAAAVDVPVINAGDGAGEHPTQGLYDMFTIYEKFGHLDNLIGVVAGDLLYGRTAHSLIKGLSIYKNITLYLLAPDALQLPDEDIREYTAKGMKLIKITSEDDMPADANFWYWTRIQKERFEHKEDITQLQGRYILTPDLVKAKAGKDTIFLHPLPRVGEIDVRVDSDPRALYLPTETANGYYLRMALLDLILGQAR